MRVILPFVLNGQSLEKAKGFPKKVVSSAKDCIVLKVENVPDGAQGSAYFKLSWESGKTYTLPVVSGEVVVDEYLTTLPKNTNDYVDYVLSVSFAFNGHGEDNRLTTDPVDLVLEKTNYSNETENVPDLPEDQYEVIVRDVVYLLETVDEIDKRLIPSLEKRVTEIEDTMPIVDGALDIESANAVQNKVVTENINDINERLEELESGGGTGGGGGAGLPDASTALTPDYPFPLVAQNGEWKIATAPVVTESNLASVRAQVSNHDKQITDLETSVGDIETQVGNIETHVDDLDTLIGDIGVQVGDLETSIGAIDSALDAIIAMQEETIALQEELIGGDGE